jgi:hypothetical protein
MISASRVCILVVCAVIGGGLTACGDDDAQTADGGGSDSAGSTESGSSAEASTQIVGGRSVLRLDPQLRKVLDAAHVKIAPAAEASRADNGIALPITAGQLDIDTPSGTVQHAGAIEFSAFGRSVRADNLVLRPQDGVVTARIDGERVSLFSADVGQPEVIETSDTVVLPTDVSIGDGAVDALNDALGAKVFDSGLHIGRLTASAKQPSAK